MPKASTEFKKENKADFGKERLTYFTKMRLSASFLSQAEC